MQELVRILSREISSLSPAARFRGDHRGRWRTQLSIAEYSTYRGASMYNTCSLHGRLDMDDRLKGGG